MTVYNCGTQNSTEHWTVLIIFLLILLFLSTQPTADCAFVELVNSDVKMLLLTERLSIPQKWPASELTKTLYRSWITSGCSAWWHAIVVK